VCQDSSASVTGTNFLQDYYVLVKDLTSLVPIADDCLCRNVRHTLYMAIRP
jgi:hypothetical protein